MALKKSELYGTLWKSCDELRGGMDASQYKDYVLTLLFVKYVSDKYKDDKSGVVVVPEGGSFDDLVSFKGDKEIGDKINKAIAKLAEANGLKGTIDLTDFNDPEKLGSGKDMQDRLTKLVGIFESSFDFSRNRADGDDLLGDAYEYLMRHFATESGKSKGQFYTPAEVSRVLAKVIEIDKSTHRSQSIYDPTCGSGSLLLKAYHDAPNGVTIYGQENDNATKALAVMNMWLHGCPTAEIWKGNTLAEPHFKNKDDGSLKTFDYVVANPPFSTKSWSNGFDPINDQYGRFAGYGVPPDKNGDYAFLLHIVRSMKSTGKAAVILPHGVLFRGNSESEIRKNLILRKFIKGIVGLPANLFYGTGIPACVIVLDKAGSDAREGIFMIDASKGFIKDGNKNRLRDQDIHKIVDTFAKQAEIEKYSRFVPFSEIEANDYNLNIPRYVDTQEDEDVQNIEAHLRGGIPEDDIEALDAFWEVCPNLRKSLFKPSDQSGFEDLLITKDAVRETIFEHPEFKAFALEFRKAFANWEAQVTPELEAVAEGSHPKALVHSISEKLLESFQALPLVDSYDAYQHLMDYWNETMQDDAYLVSVDGWTASPELVPESLVVARYFKTEKSAVEDLETERDALDVSLEVLEEEHAGDEGLLTDAKNDKDKITAASVKSRLKAIKGDSSADEERAVLETYADLAEKRSDTEKKIKEMTRALGKKVAEKYGTMSEAETREIVVADKWLASIESHVGTELDQVSQALTSRVHALAERYEKTLPDLEKEAETLSAAVEAHLAKMGFVW